MRNTPQEQAEFYKNAKSINELRQELAKRNLSTGGTKGELAWRLAQYWARRHSRDRRGERINSVADLTVADRLTNKWGQEMKVVRIDGRTAYAEHGRNSSKAGQTVRLTDEDVARLNVRTPGDTKRHWDDYSPEAGHRKM